MPLSVGEKLGPYEILAPLGAGGMGEVWKGADTRLGREVAIKLSREQFSNRFNREAKAVASINHHNICQLYDVGPNYLVMELVEGPTLADRIKKGPVPLNEALVIARQIADALDAAHQAGIIHRDLKPANIKLKADSMVKILDFGLARMDGAPNSARADSHAETATFDETQPGTILGTVAYMSPEQARGQTVDKRTDIWAFGVTFYELLTGRQPFQSPTVPDILAAVLNKEPDLGRVPVPARELLRWCLEKDPNERLRDIGDVHKLLDLPWVAPTSEPAPRLARRWIAWAAVAALAVLAAVSWMRPQPAAAPYPSLALSLLPSVGTHLPPVGNGLATPLISPDGSSVVYRVVTSSSRWLELRRLDSFEPATLQGSDRVSNSQFWSPDSRFVAFPALAELKRVRVPDGAPEVIANLPGLTLGGAWSNHGSILFTSRVQRQLVLYSVPASGGEPRRVNIAGLSEGDFLLPEFLPGSEDFLVPFQRQGAEQVEVYLASLRGGAAANLVLLFRNETVPHYTPVGGGHILFVRNDNLYAQRLDLRERKLTGDPVLIERGVASAPGDPHFSVSTNGVIAWRPGRTAYSQLALFDREGKTVGTAGPPMFTNSVRLSPDEARVLVDSQSGDWLVERGRAGRQSLGKPRWFLWSANGSSLWGLQGSRLVERPMNNSETVRDWGDTGGAELLEDISADGKTVLLGTGGSVVVLNLNDPVSKRRPLPILQTGEVINGVRFSPDGRWVVYRARTSQNQSLGIYVQPFPSGGLQSQISTGGSYPVWRPDGKEILYYDQDRIWSVPVNTTGGHFRAGEPQPLFPVQAPPGLVVGRTPLAVSHDGSRIFFPQPVEQPGSDVIRIRTGWVEKTR